MADNPSSLGGSSDEFHSSFDRSDEQNVAFAVALSLNGWRIRRGRGPRNHDICLYCRGNITDDCEIFVHEVGSCHNAWPLSCFLGGLKMDLAELRDVRCPLCRIDIACPREMDQFLRPEGPRPPVPAALLRFTLFSPDFVLHYGLQEKRPIIFMEESAENKLLSKMFKDDAALFRQCCWVRREKGEHQSIQVMPFQDPLGPVTTPVFAALVLVDFGHNIFRMCTFLPREMEDLRYRLVAGGAIVRSMSGGSFDAEAELRGGLSAALDGISAGELDKDMAAAQKAGQAFLCGSEGSREAWEEQACFHLLMEMSNAGYAAKQIDNVRFNQFVTRYDRWIPETVIIPDSMLSTVMDSGDGLSLSNSHELNPNAAEDDVLEGEEELSSDCDYDDDED
ncbi:uncharacterized protein A1O9_04751 [Exophiala aquamarina CBS 119918]|uniref:Uncharacterized protein n=1 Tax=Exophiala aquamarina CBS 119918 TaxID=1182545 RepID=A0A072PKP1_9EURO|nr:uncharacterized protein A1O9_04751 [Exophiala aquamarina CBS 119918]KEF59903.1 hypothetical protein A1O9_04751 [Exophiala aquamarina CBS 119918]